MGATHYVGFCVANSNAGRAVQSSASFVHVPIDHLFHFLPSRRRSRDPDERGSFVLVRPEVVDEGDPRPRRRPDGVQAPDQRTTATGMRLGAQRSHSGGSHHRRHGGALCDSRGIVGEKRVVSSDEIGCAITRFVVFAQCSPTLDSLALLKIV